MLWTMANKGSSLFMNYFVPSKTYRNSSKKVKEIFNEKNILLICVMI